ncbi:MAG: hypothetical protein CBC35_03935 [Planctomycetes bacterium TMED75]|nr:hypothetical protein [Planctomycetaceae bacterium]OUU94574.1 MAG: hypothetical protein CBC35_03935 [Planctomycetes bacterium TMED75]
MINHRSTIIPPWGAWGVRGRGWCLLLVCLGMSGGCASRPVDSPVVISSQGDPLAGVPADFEVQIQVMVGRKCPDQNQLQRREASMLLLPDGSLHAATGRLVVPGSRPGLARTLYQDQVVEFWALLGRLDLLEAGALPVGPVRPPGAMEIVYVLEITANNTRRRIIDRLVQDETNAALVTVIRSLGGLAWLRDAPPPANLIEPLRYDFGPDPWARYRASKMRSENEQ